MTNPAEVLVAAVRTSILTHKNHPYARDIVTTLALMQPDNDNRDEDAKRKFEKSRLLGKSTLEAFLDNELDPILAPKNLATREVLDIVIRSIITELEPGNPADITLLRPPNIFCAAVGVMVAGIDPRSFQNWIGHCLRRILLAVREAAETIPAPPMAAEEAEPSDQATVVLLRHMASPNYARVPLQVLAPTSLTPTPPKPRLLIMASPARSQLVLKPELQNAVTHRASLASYTISPAPPLAQDSWGRLATESSKRQSCRRIGTSAFKRLAVTLVYLLSGDNQSCEEDAFIHAVLTSSATCARVLKVLYQDVAKCSFRRGQDTPAVLDAFVIYIGAQVASSADGYIRFQPWFNAVFLPLGKAAVAALTPKIPKPPKRVQDIGPPINRTWKKSKRSTFLDVSNLTLPAAKNDPTATKSKPRRRQNKNQGGVVDTDIHGSTYGPCEALVAALDLFAEGVVRAHVHSGRLEDVNKVINQLRSFEITDRKVVIPDLKV
ncbi:hypothetical protein C8R44DRAFT_880029 [Mycena epipterygia]|nr:hypothetical protein C8R44DRAFT_880029 [Mycena epipterygia]